MLNKIMLKVLFLAYVVVVVNANDNTPIYMYEVEVNVQSTKINGKDWDISGGAPDVYVKVDGVFLTMTRKCRNTYRCSVMFVSKTKSWYFEVYDKDVANNDLIGKGTCSADRKCYLGRSTVKVKRVNQ